jgi:hypothetical protein
MSRLRVVDVTDLAAFRLVPPCADPGFDHRSCDYWEDAERGSKAARLSWLTGLDGPREAGVGQEGGSAPRRRSGNPFLDEMAGREPGANPFAVGRGAAAVNPFAPTAKSPDFNPFALDEEADRLADNPFAPQPKVKPTVGPDAPRKLRLLGRGLGVFGSYAKVLLVDEQPAAYCQFGPLTAYPRAQRLRDLYPQLPSSPLPAVITCIASTAEARGGGWAGRLVAAVCDDLGARGFAAVEAYPERRAKPDATPSANDGFWLAAGFTVAVEDEHYPVLRRELG